jgi:GMP synthase PP-ATPase subunit
MKKGRGRLEGDHVATRIINEMRGINCIVYDYTSKPPGAIVGVRIT